MLIGVLVVALTLVCCSAVSADDEWTEQQVQQSKQWKDGRSPLILTKSGSLPDSYLKNLLEAIRGSKVAHFKVLCEGLPAAGDENVCQSLTKYHVAVRSGGTVEGVPVFNDSDAAFVSSVLEFLLSSSITKLWSYSDLTKYSTQHPQHLLTVTPSSEEYAALLSAMLVKPLPLGVAMTAGVLPLSERGPYSQPPSLLRLWYIVQGEHWYSNQDMSGFNLQVVQKCKTPAQLIREFVERVHHPIVTHYKDDDTLRKQFFGSGLHMAIVFPGESGPDAESVAVSVAQATFMNYAFVIMPDRSRLRRFITGARPSLHIIVLPYGHKTDLLRFLVEGTYLVYEVRHITYSLRTYAVEKPRSIDGPEVYASLGPSMTTVSEIQKSVLATRKHHLFAYFCLQGSQRCVQIGYKVVHEVLSVIRVTDLGRTMAAHVVIYKTANTKPFKLKNLTTCALYNSTTKAWTAATENISSGSEALQFISKLTGRRELAEVARAMIHATLTLAEVPPPPKPLQEDDSFGLVAESMADPIVPMEIQLTSYNFQQNIAKFNKTAVVFCVRWSIQCKVFLHQTIAAHYQLQLTKDLNISLAMVGCDNYTELCFRYHIKAYPTVLLFTPSTINNPTPLNGILDSTQLLAALSQSEDKHGSLPELTPKSLPTLLTSGAGLDSTFVLWCADDVSSDIAKTFIQQASDNPHADLIFTWINSTNHSHLLSRIIPGISTFPVIVALNFKQHQVYLLAVEESRETFSSKLSSFLKELRLGTLEVFGHLPKKMWSPLLPPIPFPSTNHTHHSHHKSKMSDHNSQYPKSDDSTPSSGHQHLHTEL